jgi:WD40 repeat protein
MTVTVLGTPQPPRLLLLTLVATAFSPGGGLVASGGDDRSVRLWNATTHKQVAAAVEHTGAVQTVACTPR